MIPRRAAKLFKMLRAQIATLEVRARSQAHPTWTSPCLWLRIDPPPSVYDGPEVEKGGGRDRANEIPVEVCCTSVSDDRLSHNAEPAHVGVLPTSMHKGIKSCSLASSYSILPQSLSKPKQKPKYMLYTYLPR